MSTKIDVEVVIGGKVLTLSGYERAEYLQQVASYINNKMNTYNKLDGFQRQPIDMQNILLQLNIADDYFKAKEQAAIYNEEIEFKTRELYDTKHELITEKMKIEDLEKAKSKLTEELKEAQLKIVKLETELEKSKKNTNTYKAVN